MNKKPMIITLIFVLSALICSSIGYTVVQFYNVEKRLTQTTQHVFHQTVKATYDIIDTTVNEAIENYLRGVAFTVKDVVTVTQNKSLHFKDQNIEHALDALINQIHVGKSGYVSILSPSGIYLSHPFLKNTDVSHFAFIQKQLSQDSSFLEYEWKNPGDEKPRLKVAFSVKLPNGNVVSASAYKSEMLSLVDRDFLKQKLREYNYGKTGYVYVMNSHGQLILHPTNEGQPISTLIGNSANRFMAQALSDHEGTFTYLLHPQNGQEVTKTVAYKYYPFLDWIIASGISTDELTHSTTLLSHGLLMAGVSLFLVIGALVVTLTYRHKRQLRAEKKDFLTGLHNRRSFMQYANSKGAKLDNGYSVIILDIDYFKAINDTYGHNEGDNAIRETANILKQYQSRRILASRHGGEEFVLLLQNMNLHQAYLLAELIRSKVAAIDCLPTQFTISAGIYESTEAATPVSEAISYADHALYQAKQTGRNKVVSYQPEFDEMTHGNKN
ncbi:diguanylate cyclase [Vibrio sp. CK2-1]|uniref:diguanylate cyclase domain-containing protein n=1 Tax=Vibrio sp. CK2-1 TaxID=2912249 RepID=UPI001F172EC5|nr:diguanylate cyclase [Vibrio sp. CK2-1]MCF7354606.1 diguanylate cyclase [Vibrio sp. CK2-1]